MYFHKDDDAIMLKKYTIMMPRGLSFSNDINQCIISHTGIFFLKHHMVDGIDEHLPGEIIDYSSIIQVNWPKSSVMFRSKWKINFPIFVFEILYIENSQDRMEKKFVPKNAQFSEIDLSLNLIILRFLGFEIWSILYSSFGPVLIIDIQSPPS